MRACVQAAKAAGILAQPPRPSASSAAAAEISGGGSALLPAAAVRLKSMAPLVMNGQRWARKHLSYLGSVSQMIKIKSVALIVPPAPSGSTFWTRTCDGWSAVRARRALAGAAAQQAAEGRQLFNRGVLRAILLHTSRHCFIFGVRVRARCGQQKHMICLAFGIKKRHFSVVSCYCYIS